VFRFDGERIEVRKFAEHHEGSTRSVEVDVRIPLVQFLRDLLVGPLDRLFAFSSSSPT
jgi:hypothetical protein